MSILLFTEDGWLVSHLQYLNTIYKRVTTEGKYCSLEFKEECFHINSQFMRNNQFSKSEHGILKRDVGKSKKRKRSDKLSSEDLEQVNYVKDAFGRMRSCKAIQQLFEKSNTYDNNQAARAISELFYSESSEHRLGNFHGANNTETSIIKRIGDEKYVFPQRSSFYSYDVRGIAEKLDQSCRYDFILIDPPWWNKFVRRRKEKSLESSYKMMYNEDLAKIPIQNLVNPNGIVAVWCTNAPSHLYSIMNEMFSSWGITYIAKWYWVKVTQSGNTICDFNMSTGKQPYEILVFGRKSMNCETKIPDKKLIVSVPSSVHSHKPPIAEIIKPYLKNNPQCLEIFARYLLPDWTSWGLEVLKFQHLSLYKIVDVENNDNSIKQ